jgi:hypothetical protein
MLKHIKDVADKSDISTAKLPVAATLLPVNVRYVCPGFTNTLIDTKVDVKELEDLNLIDSPGFNDPNKERSDNKIFSDIVDTVH